MRTGLINSIPFPIKLTSDYNNNYFNFNITRRGKLLKNISLNSRIIKMGDIVNYSASTSWVPKNTTYNGGTPKGFDAIPLLNNYRVSKTDKSLFVSFKEVPFYNFTNSLKGSFSGGVNIYKEGDAENDFSESVSTNTSLYIGKKIRFNYNRNSNTYTTCKITSPSNKTIATYLVPTQNKDYVITEEDAATATKGNLNFTFEENTQTAQVKCPESYSGEYDVEVNQPGLTTKHGTSLFISAYVDTNILINKASNKPGYYLAKSRIISTDKTDPTKYPQGSNSLVYYFDDNTNNIYTENISSPLPSYVYTISPLYIKTIIRFNYMCTSITPFDSNTPNTSGTLAYIPGKPFTVNVSISGKYLRQILLIGTLHTTEYFSNTSQTSGTLTQTIELNIADSYRLKLIETNSLSDKIQVYESGSSSNTNTIWYPSCSFINLGSFTWSSDKGTVITIQYAFKKPSDSSVTSGTKTITVPENGKINYLTLDASSSGTTPKPLIQFSIGTKSVIQVKGNLNVNIAHNTYSYLRFVVSIGGATCIEVNPIVGDAD